MANKQYTLGIVSVSFRGHEPKEIIKAAKAAGLSSIEWGSDVHAPCRDKERLMEIAGLQKDCGLTCSSYGTYLRLGETDVSELEVYISAAKLLETNILRLWCGTKSGADYTEAQRQQLRSLCKQAANIAQKNGVKLCMENHQHSFTERIDDALWLMREVASDAFRMYWQPFQWQSASENEHDAAAIAKYTEHIHVFNWRDKQKLPLIEAIDEWRSYLSHFEPPRTLLLEFMPNGTIAELLNETRALRMIAGQEK
jgi:sugar phosphate isomerase/epimerase